MAWPTLSTAESSHGKRRRFHDTQRESMRGSEQKIMAGGQRLWAACAWEYVFAALKQHGDIGWNRTAQGQRAAMKARNLVATRRWS
jgi:hypothetical protein